MGEVSDDGAGDALSKDEETLGDAAHECIQGSGGYKRVGHFLWPDLPLRTAARRLERCVATEASEKLSPPEIENLARFFSWHGQHGFMWAMADLAGYQRPEPQTSVKRITELFERYHSLHWQLQKIHADIKREIGFLQVSDESFLDAAESEAGDPKIVRREFVAFRDELWREVERRDGPNCRWCGTSENLSIDHVFPVIRGGTNEVGNLQILCRSCNSTKGTKVVDIGERING